MKMKNNTNTTETIKLAAELAKTIRIYGISEEGMQEIMEAHNGNAKAAIRTIEATSKMVKKYGR